MLILNVEWLVRLEGSKEPYAFLVANGFTNQEALRILNKETEEMIFDEIERLTQLFNCSANDLFDWYGDADSHLAKLKKPTMEELERMLEKIGPKEIREIVRQAGGY